MKILLRFPGKGKLLEGRPRNGRSYLGADCSTPHAVTLPQNCYNLTASYGYFHEYCHIAIDFHVNINTSTVLN